MMRKFNDVEQYLRRAINEETGLKKDAMEFLR